MIINKKDFLNLYYQNILKPETEELDQEKLPALLKIKYQAINDATEILGGVDKIRQTFINFQKHLFAEHVEA